MVRTAATAKRFTRSECCHEGNSGGSFVSLTSARTVARPLWQKVFAIFVSSAVEPKMVGRMTHAGTLPDARSGTERITLMDRGRRLFARSTTDIKSSVRRQKFDCASAFEVTWPLKGTWSNA